MAQFKFVMWLAYWYSQAEGFIFEWDKGNIAKSKLKHGVAPDDVEAIFTAGLAVPLGRQVSPETEEERLCIVGPTSVGRMISVVFTIREGQVRPISARPASRKERSLYEEVRKTLEKIR